MTDPMVLLQAREYQAAADVCEARLAIDYNDLAATDGLSAAYFSLGRYAEAIPLMQRMNQIERSRNAKTCGRGIDISCAHWCLGERDEAIRIMHAQCAGILDRSITYAPDGGGGSTMGVLLHYMAVTTGNTAENEYAVKYLKKLNQKFEMRPFETPWPSHLVKYVLGLMSFEDMIKGATEQNVLEDAIRIAIPESGLLKRRYLSEALFHTGVAARKNGDEAIAQKWFKQVYRLPDPIIEQEWYLARYECDAITVPVC